MTNETVAQLAVGEQQLDVADRVGDVPRPHPERHSALKFLDFIFEGVVGGYAEFRFFGAGLKPKVVDESAHHLLPIEHDWVEKEILSRSGRQMITVGPAPRFQTPPRGKGGKDQDVLQTSCIWADLDFKHYKGGAIEVIQRIRDFPLRPSVVINSATGDTFISSFTPPYKQTSLPLWDRMIRGLRDALDADATINLSRVMRLPGTPNIKHPDAPVMCELCDEDSSWLRYHPDEVLGAIEQAASLKHSGPEIISGSLAAKLPADWKFSPSELRRRGVPEAVRTAIYTGQRTIQTGSHAGRSDDDRAEISGSPAPSSKRDSASKRSKPSSVASRVGAAVSGAETTRREIP
jgi:hypothetical protein